MREPHWHPNAWEFDCCIAGRAKMTVLSPEGEVDSFDVAPGDIVFVPQGYFHYFEISAAGISRCRRHQTAFGKVRYEFS